MKLARLRSRSMHTTGLWLALSSLMLLAACATPFVATQRDFQPLPPESLEQPVSVLLKLDSRHGETRHHWQAVLNVDAERIYLVILGPLGRRLATLSVDDQHRTITKDAPGTGDIPLERLLGELQMIFWPLIVLNADERNRDWYFEQQKHLRRVYYQQRSVAEIHRHPSSPWSGDFDYISQISDYRLRVQSSRLEP